MTDDKPSNLSLESKAILSLSESFNNRFVELTPEERAKAIMQLVDHINSLAPKTIRPKQIPPFYTKDGKVIKNLTELIELLPSMPDDVFYHHVTPERNDFANWIRDCYKDELLAEKVRSAKSQLELAIILKGSLYAGNLDSVQEHNLFTEPKKPSSDSLRKQIQDAIYKVQQGDILEAKKRYVNLSELLEKANLDVQEKRKLTNLLHELYTEIHLAKITRSLKH